MKPAPGRGGGGGGGRGSQIQKSGKLSNGWTDWHQIWYTSADSSGNGQAVKRLDRLATNLAHMSADSSGNGYTPNKLPFETQGEHLGVLGGQTFKSLEKLSNVWTNLHQLWFMSANSSGNGHRLQVTTQYPRGHFGGF